MSTILIIDDDKAINELIKVNLKLNGYNIIQAYDGIEGFALTKQELPNLVLLDVMMPNVDGFDVLAALSKSEETSNIPVVILSALNSESDIEKALSNGAKDFVTKPILMDKLLNCILRTLGEEELPS